MKQKIKSILFLFVTVVVTAAIVKLVEAGSLTPSATPAATMRSLEDIDAVLEGSFNAATTTANFDGNVLEILKCIHNKREGSSC